MYIRGTDGPDNLNGTSGDDVIDGLKGDDFLFGLGGDDIFDWRAGTGNRRAGEATIYDSDGADHVDGGSGNDQFRVIADNYYTLSGRNGDTNPLQYELIAGANGDVSFRVSSWWVSYAFVPARSGTSETIVTVRDVESFTFLGAQSPDTGGYPLTERDEHHLVVGNLGGTAMTGLIQFIGGAGNDSIRAAEAVNRIVALGGAGDDILIGGAGSDELLGGDGNDLLQGGGAANALLGGAGDDRYVGVNSQDTLIENAGEGVDEVSTAETYYALRANLEILRFIGTAGFTGVGNAEANLIEGGAGNDYLIGLGGHDDLRGLGGTDTLQGGVGNDVYYIDGSDDTVFEFENEGLDRVYTGGLRYTLGANVEQLYYQGSGDFTGVGNALDNWLQGGSGSDYLIGLDGNDILYGAGGANSLQGGRGDDVYLVESNDTLVEFANEGVDRVETSLLSFTLGDHFEDLRYFGSGQFTGTGNSVDNRIQGGNGRDTLYGLDGNDTLLGGAGHDFLVGGGGADILIGGSGGDELSGGGGADRFVFLASTDAKDLIHDFNRSQGDKIDVSALLDSIGYSGPDPFATGHLRIEAIEAFGGGGVPATNVVFDADGSAGPQAGIDLIVVLGGTSAVEPADFII